MRLFCVSKVLQSSVLCPVGKPKSSADIANVSWGRDKKLPSSEDHSARGHSKNYRKEVVT